MSSRDVFMVGIGAVVAPVVYELVTRALGRSTLDPTQRKEKKR